MCSSRYSVCLFVVCSSRLHNGKTLVQSANCPSDREVETDNEIPQVVEPSLSPQAPSYNLSIEETDTVSF